MAAIEWHEDAWRLFNDHVDYARYEFGRKTSNKWLKEMADIDKWLRIFPESYTQEPLLRGRTIVYRYCRIMKRFKIIYHYDKTEDTVHIVDLWDTLQNPVTLGQRIE